MRFRDFHTTKELDSTDYRGTAFYFGGPEFTEEETVLVRYADTNAAAVIVRKTSRSVVLLTGLHLESREDVDYRSCYDKLHPTYSVERFESTLKRFQPTMNPVTDLCLKQLNLSIKTPARSGVLVNL